MGYQWVKVRAFVDEGERPDQGLPSTPGQPPYPDQGLPPYPDQGLPPYPGQGLPPHVDNGLPPYIWTGPIYPPVYPPYPDQGLPPYVDNTLPPVSPGQPDNSLPPEPVKEPKAYDIGDEPEEPPEGGAGEYVVVILNDKAVWAWVESDGDVEIEPPEPVEPE